MAVLAALLHVSAAAYIGYVAVRDSDANPLYFLGIAFFVVSAAEMLLQRFRKAPTRAYAAVTILNVAFVPFIVIGCLTIIGNIFNNNANPVLVLGAVAALIMFSVSSLVTLQPVRVLTPGRPIVLVVAITTLGAGVVLAMPHLASTLLEGSSGGGYVGQAERLNAVATSQGIATVVLIAAWIVLLVTGLVRRRRLDRG